jgi:hypothetical protein
MNFKVQAFNNKSILSIILIISFITNISSGIIEPDDILPLEIFPPFNSQPHISGTKFIFRFYIPNYRDKDSMPTTRGYGAANGQYIGIRFTPENNLFFYNNVHDITYHECNIIQIETNRNIPLKAVRDENKESVMLDYYPKAKPEYDNKELEYKWEKLIKLKEEVAKHLEIARGNKDIGLSLEAKVTLFAEGEEYEFIKGKEELLKEIFIVSSVEIRENRRNADEEVGVGVKVDKAPGEKCERCWMYSETVGESSEHPTLCERCRDNLVE